MSTTEREQEKLNTGRLMRAEADLILPLISTKQSLALNKIVAAFKAGERDIIFAVAAELSTLHDMKHDITRKIKEAERIEQRMIDDMTEDANPTSER